MCSPWLRGAQSAAGECLRFRSWERKMLGYVGFRALQGGLHGPHHGSDRSGHYFTPGRWLVRPRALVLGLAEVGPRDLVEVLSQPVERLEVLVFVRPPLHVSWAKRLSDLVHPENIAVERALFAHQQCLYPVVPLRVPGLALLAQFHPPAVRCR